jgi:hypothetical protein
MVKLTALMYVLVAPTLMGILVVGILAMASPTAGGTLLAQQGMTLLLVVLGAAIAALPIAYVIAGMINKAINS